MSPATTVKVGTFNLNNLFSRFNLYTEADPQIASDSDDATLDEPRPWLSPPAADADGDSEVEVVSRGEVGADGRLWWRREFMGRLIRAKDPAAQKTLADRIAALDVDVLCAQEVENIEALEDFVRHFGLRDAGFKHLSLIEGNDNRFIDVAVISKLPFGAVTSWRHHVHPDELSSPVFSRDLLQAEILGPNRDVMLTVYVNHLKSKLARNDAERTRGDERRQLQAESVIDIIDNNPPRSPYLVVGDMNDTPDSQPLRAFDDAGLTNALATAREIGGPYPSDDPTPPPDGKPWTHRYRADGTTTYELYDQIWASPDLADRIADAWIHRRTLRGGNASDHDPAAIELRGF